MKTIYTPIAVSSGELPTIEKRYVIYSEDVTVFDLDNEMHICFYDFDKGCWRNRFFLQVEITHWLKKQEVPELTDEEKQQWKQQRVSKILEEANGSWKDLLEDGFDLGIEYAKLTSKVEVKWEENTNTRK